MVSFVNKAFRENKKTTLESLKSVQDILITKAEIFEEVQALQMEKKKLKEEIFELHHERLRSIEIAAQMRELQSARVARANYGQLVASEYALSMEGIIVDLWHSQVLECFEGLVKYFNFQKKHNRSRLDPVWNWMKNLDSRTGSPKYLTLTSSWCAYLQGLDKDHIMRMVYEEWLDNPFINRYQRETRYNRSTIDMGSKTSTIEYFYFVRDMTAHYGDNPEIFRALITGPDHQEARQLAAYKYVEKSMMLLFDELSGYGLHGMLGSIIDAVAPVEVQASLQSFLDFDMIGKLLRSPVVRWPPRCVMSMNNFINNNLNR